MRLTDYVTLLKSGMSLDEIKEREAHENAVVEEEVVQIETTVEEPVAEVEEVTEPEPDYKALYEESQKNLKELQQQNTKENMKPTDPTVSDEDIINEAFRSLM